MLFSQLNIFLDVPCVAQPLIIFYPIIFKIRLNEGLTIETIMNSNIYLPSTVVSLKKSCNNSSVFTIFVLFSIV